MLNLSIKEILYNLPKQLKAICTLIFCIIFSELKLKIKVGMLSRENIPRMLCTFYIWLYFHTCISSKAKCIQLVKIFIYTS